MKRGRPLPRARARGFAYVLLLLCVAVLGIAASASLSLGAAMARRHAERQLLEEGRHFQSALRSYAGLAPMGATPAGAHGPRTLEELLRDPRVPGVRRHLRRIPADPLTGRHEWGLMRDAQGFIVGVHSLAPGRPIRQSGFEAQWLEFEGAREYRQWVFGLPHQEQAKRSAGQVGLAGVP